jgi:hypothetical protein
MASLAHRKDIAETIATTRRDAMDFPFATEDSITTAGMAAGLHGALAPSTRALVRGFTFSLSCRQWALLVCEVSVLT